jgi:hypothetical protein
MKAKLLKKLRKKYLKQYCVYRDTYSGRYYVRRYGKTSIGSSFGSPSDYQEGAIETVKKLVNRDIQTYLHGKRLGVFRVNPWSGEIRYTKVNLVPFNFLLTAIIIAVLLVSSIIWKVLILK